MSKKTPPLPKEARQDHRSVDPDLTRFRDRGGRLSCTMAERSVDFAAEYDQLLRECGRERQEEQRRRKLRKCEPGIRAAVHGARHDALCRRSGTEQLRHGGGAGAMGRAEATARKHHRVAHDQRGSRSHTALCVYPKSASYSVQAVRTMPPASCAKRPDPLPTPCHDATSSMPNVPPRPASRGALVLCAAAAVGQASSASHQSGDGDAQQLHGGRERPRAAAGGHREGEASHPRHVRRDGLRLRAAAGPGRAGAGAGPGGPSGRHRRGLERRDRADGCRARQRRPRAFG